MTTMKAIGTRRYGTPEVLEWMDVPRPTIKADSVLIRVAAAGVNPADSLIRSGGFRLFTKLPFIPGAEVAGVVEAVGENVKRVRVGDAVYAMLPNVAGGGYAQFAVAAENTIALIPPTLSFTDAASLPLTALTALQALRDNATVKPSDRVLINGASGGVGVYAVQIAKAMGAHVTAVCSGRNADLVFGLGADAVIDYNQTELTTINARFNVIFDAVGLHPFGKLRPLLREYGVMVTVNPGLGNPLAVFLSRFGGTQRFKSLLVRPNGNDLDSLAEWIVQGKLRPVIDQCYPLAQAAEAQRYSETKRVRGKVVLIVDEVLAAKPIRNR